MISVVVRDYQVIKKLDLNIEGIVFVTGPSNNGKSSLVKAIESCLYNRAGESFIRDTEGQALVGITFRQQNTPPLQIAWKKPRGAGASYVVNGVKYEKAGRTPLPELMQQGLTEMEASKRTFRLPFWHQMEAFLVSEPNTVVFEVLSRLLQDRKVIPILQTMKADFQGTKSEMLQLEGRYQALLEEQANTEQVLERLTALPQLKTLAARTQAGQARYTTLITLKQQWGTRAVRVREIEAEQSRLNTPLIHAQELLQQAGALVERHVSLTALHERATKQIAILTRLSQQGKAFAALQQVKDPAALYTRWDQLLTLKQQWNQAQKAEEQLQQQATQVEQEHQQVQQAKAQFEEQELAGMCPTCGQILHEEATCPRP